MGKKQWSSPKARSKKGGLLSGWRGQLVSLAVLLVAIGATWVMTGSRNREPLKPPPKSPRADRDLKSECAGWARDGECEKNAEQMEHNCPVTCAKRRKELKKSSKASPAEAPAPSGPVDKSPHCGVWASSGECENNPTYMLAECPAACSGSPSGAEEEADLNEDCEAWVRDGECFRNPAFMLQQCKASCGRFAASNSNILQDTSDTCVNFALRGGCTSDPKKAETQCRASCHIKRICSNHTEEVACSKALRCEAIGDKDSSCAARARAGKCYSDPRRMLKECIKSCSELDLDGMMRFHLPHVRTTLSPLIDLPHQPPRLAGFYSTPPSEVNTALEARAQCPAVDAAREGFRARMGARRGAAHWRRPWSAQHWPQWSFAVGAERTPRVPHLFRRVPAEADAAAPTDRHVVVEHVSFSPRIRYLHRLLTPEECDHVIKLATPLFGRSPVRGSVTRVRTSTLAWGVIFPLYLLHLLYISVISPGAHLDHRDARRPA
jgi:hypothetical protein